MVKRTDAIANQGRVLTAARAVFAQKGLNAEIKEVAEAAGVGIGTIYRSYGDRNGLITALTRDFIAEFGALSANCLSQPDAKLALHSFVRQALQHSETYGWLIGAALGWQLPPEANDALNKAGVAGQIQQLIRRCVNDGVMREDADVDTASLQILGHLLLWAYRDESAPDLDSTASRVVDLLLRGAGR